MSFFSSFGGFPFGGSHFGGEEECTYSHHLSRFTRSR